MLVRCCICFGCAVGLINDCLGIFTTAIVDDLQVGVGEFSIMLTLLNVASALTTLLLVSRLIERVHIGALMGAGALICAVTFLAMSSFTSLAAYYLAGIVIGAGMSCFATLPVTYVLKTWYGLKNGLVTGIAMGCSGAVGVVANPVCSLLIESLGYRPGFRVIGLAFALLAVPAALTMRLGPERSETSVRTQEHVAPSFMVTARLMLLAACFTLMGCMTSHVSVLGQDDGYALSFAALMVSMVMVANIVFKTVLGLIADRMGALRATVMGIVLCMLGTGILLFGGGNQVLALIGAFLFGASSSLHTVAISLVSQRVAGDAYTAVFSKVTVTVALSYALFISLAGFLRDATGSYDAVLLLGIAVGVLALVLCRSFAANRRNADR